MKGTKVYKDREIYLKSWAYSANQSDTLSKLASRLGVSNADLAKLNGLAEDAVLKNNQELQVPGKFSHELNRNNGYLMLGRMQGGQNVRPFDPASLKQVQVTVKEGETLADLAKQHKTTEKHLKALNAVEDGEDLIGDMVFIDYSVMPTKTATAQGIANFFNVTIEDFLELNDLVTEDDFDASKRVHIPIGQQMRMSRRASVAQGGIVPVYEVVLGSKKYKKLKDKYAPKKDSKKNRGARQIFLNQ